MSSVARFNREKHLRVPEGKQCLGCGAVWISQAVCPRCSDELRKESESAQIDTISPVVAAAISQTIAKEA